MLPGIIQCYFYGYIIIEWSLSKMPEDKYTTYFSALDNSEVVYLKIINNSKVFF